jgi:predicted LPLAT superfamily acyltransferase
MLKTAKEKPSALIMGRPIYDESIPMMRYYCRYITHVWVWIETLSFKIRDSMCGFRVYPLKLMIPLLKKIPTGNRMDFDIEISVRMYWEHIDILNLPTKITYRPDNPSHFMMFRDNMLITVLHTRLFFGMLSRFPQLVKRCLKAGGDDRHKWFEIEERGSQLGIKFLVWCYSIFGKGLFNLMLYPVIVYFLVTGTKSRRASRDFLNRVFTLYPGQDGRNRKVALRDNYLHFLEFGRAAMDKLAAWLGKINYDNILWSNREEGLALVRNKTGAILVASHLGNIEVLRAIADNKPEVRINALVHTRHADKFNRVLSKINTRSNVELIEVNSITPETAMLMKEKIDKGEFISIVGDRIPVDSSKRKNYAPFLGKPAPFPQGPFILGSIMKCPVYLIFCMKIEKSRFKIYFERFADKIELPRRDREKALQVIIEKYAERLEYYCSISPYQWFNFFDFWQGENQTAVKK